ncbi:MAG: carbamoyl-phosphate synthase (glutamine-hydrolyzing) large subunit [Candidatus Diapherotrites archaeon]
MKPAKVLLLGSGGIRIGQAAEFDYSGSQALKALKEEGIETVLVNPNIATIQTSELADKVYLEPITPEFLEKIIELEKPDGILLSFGGQTALNAGVKLEEKGILKKHGVKVLGTGIEVIKKTEDREEFKKAMKEADVSVPESRTAISVKSALEAAGKIGYPVIVRPAYTLGGLGSDIAWNEEELEKIAGIGLKHSMIGQVLIEKYLFHWKELEYEVVRDSSDNCITVCNMENLDPLGIHTGDSIVVAPSQTLTNKEYHLLRSAAIRVIRSLKIVGECNIQFALDPKSQQYYAIEVNARLSRSSALASKATGYPLAYIAAKLAVGFTLPELLNKVTGATKACFEPALDYIVVKIPRWEFQKFSGVNRRIGSQMKAIGEVMAIGRNFEEALQKAVRMLEIGRELIEEEKIEIRKLEEELRHPTDQRLFAIVQAVRQGMKIERIHELSGVDEWFLHKIKNIASMHSKLKKLNFSNEDFPEVLSQAKKLGFSDKKIAGMLNASQEKIRELRKHYGIIPVVKQIDTLAAEWPAKTNYLYFTYNGTENDIDFSDSAKALVLGAGPIRIGSSVEFDWCTMNCVWGLKEKGLKAIVLNCNPETVSTDYDMSDKLYFEEITLERVLDIIEKENPFGVVVSVGGQTSNNLAFSLAKRGIHILGTFGRDIDSAENRQKFSSLLDELGIAQPEWKSLASLKEIKAFSKKIGFPVIVRPSYVLSGSAMKVAFNQKELKEYVKGAVIVSKDCPIVISKFLTAMECEVDGVSDGKNVFIGAIIEHIERAGVHSGDASMVIPPQSLSEEIQEKIRDYTKRIAQSLGIKGPFNMQYLVKDREIFVIECNLRASRSMPFTSKTIGVNLIKLATKCMLGEALHETEPKIAGVCSIKVPMFSWSRLGGIDPKLSVEMNSTGEIACLGESFEEAFLKALIAIEQSFPFSLEGKAKGTVFIKGVEEKFIERIKGIGFNSTKEFDAERMPEIVIDLEKESSIRKKAAEYGIPVISEFNTAEAFVKSLEAKPSLNPKSLKEYWRLSGMEKEYKINKIENGTVIDHIAQNRALDIIEALNIKRKYPNSTISMVTNIHSKKFGVKDMLKIEGKVLSQKEIQKIARISPKATVNIIKDYEVIKKIELGK